MTILMRQKAGAGSPAVLFDGALEERVSEVLTRALALARTDGAEVAKTDVPSSPEQVYDAVADALTLAGERLAEEATGRRTKLAALVELIFDLQAVQGQLQEHRIHRRLQSLIKVQQALGRLRGLDSVERLIPQVGVEAGRACDFDRVILFRVDNSKLIAECVYVKGDDEWAARILSLARAHPPELEHGLLETEMLRRRTPALVLDPANDPRAFEPIVSETQTRAYVAAPIMPEGRVIGFLHADRYFQARDVDDFDRDTLWLFAEGLGHAIERTVLLERLRSQRDQVRRMVASTEAVLSEMSDAEVEFGRAEDRESIAVARTAAAMFVAPESRVEALLTRREREVLALMAAGATNGEIANRLVISEGTVKSHVKHILRKLRASNRAEAVSRYMRLAGMGRSE
jgi:DNA-binding CsgD family transcriptional regulator